VITSNNHYRRRRCYIIVVVFLPPSYLVAACTLVADVASRQHLRSASRHQLVVPRHWCTTLGRRAFSVAGPMAWNALPDNVRDTALGCNTFQHVLKTFLFSKY